VKKYEKFIMAAEVENGGVLAFSIALLRMTRSPLPPVSMQCERHWAAVHLAARHCPAKYFVPRIAVSIQARDFMI
jgi:hypothetical protein